jgi:fido (protein-threonine AMPylation protein)
MLVLEGEDKELYDRVQEKNLIRQYDLLTNCIEVGLKQGPRAFDKYTLWALNHVAVANISQFGGRFREEPIYVGNHIPPHFKDVPELMDRFISFIQENWFIFSPTHLAAYGLWRLNWVHPFIEGNGRTARAVCYYLLCVRSGTLLPGRKIVPERIREERDPYYAALRAADLAWHEGNLNVSVMDAYLARLLTAQLQDQLPDLPPQPAVVRNPGGPGMWVPPKPKT